MSIKIIRNFSIIAHIDHGKSTLADRMLEITKTVNVREMKEQFLDKIDIERERGITIKLQPARMEYLGHILNLVDTPGHIDFGYEVSRALAACEGAILLVDASQGIEAQTLSNYTKAQQAGLKIIPVVNKIDLPSAHPETVALDLMHTLGFTEDEILFTSGKTGEGVGELLGAIIDRVPAPKVSDPNATRALIFDSFYDAHKGVIAYVRVTDGTITKRPLGLIQNHKTLEPLELGYIAAREIISDYIDTGEVGYIATGLKDIHDVRVGDTITLAETLDETVAFPGYQEPKAMVFANLFPDDADQIKELREAVDRYRLTDAAFSFAPINSPILGSGFRCGFLGLLHLDVVRERISREFNIETQITTPNVQYHVKLRSGETQNVQSPAELPEPSFIESIDEPWCQVTIFTLAEYVGNLITITESHRAEFVDLKYFGESKAKHDPTARAELVYKMPLSEIISNYFDQLKSVSAGYASLDYVVVDYRSVDLVRLDVMLNKELHPALSRLVVRDHAREVAEKLVETLRDNLPKQQFKVPIQAGIGGTVIARADLSAVRKDVTGHLYGGDRTRKDKLLKKQAKGKKRLQAMGRVQIPHAVYQKIISI